MGSWCFSSLQLGKRLQETGLSLPPGSSFSRGHMGTHSPFAYTSIESPTTNVRQTGTHWIAFPYTLILQTQGEQCIVSAGFNCKIFHRYSLFLFASIRNWLRKEKKNLQWLLVKTRVWTQSPGRCLVGVFPSMQHLPEQKGRQQASQLKSESVPQRG